MTKQAAAVVFAAGETPQLWVDGQKNALAVAPGTPTGTLNITDVLELGRGNRPTTPPIGYFKGRCSFFALSSRRQPDEVLETITRAFKDPPQVYGHGTVNLQTDAVRSPVALLTTTTSAPGAPVTVDVGAASYDPGGLPMTCTAAAITSGNGGVSRSSDNVTITPASNAVAGDVVVCEYTLANSSGKTSNSRVYLTVSGVVIPPVQATPDPFVATVGVTAPYSPLSNDVGTGLTISSLVGSPSAGGTASIITPARTQISYTPRNTAGTETLDYVVTDGLTFATGRITWTVSAAAPAAPVTTPDSYNATAGVTATYSPLNNDTGTNLTITGLGSLTGGSTASIVLPARTQVSYTPRASTTDYTEGLTYTISDGVNPPVNGAITFSVAGVTAVVTDRPKSPPSTTAAKTKPATPSTFAAVYAAANNGDHIVCANGSYSFTAFGRVFGTTEATAVVIRSENLNAAVFTGRVDASGGRGHWFHELRFTRAVDGDSDASIVTGNYTWYTRNWFTSASAMRSEAVVGSPRTNVRIGYNRFTGSTAGAAHTNTYIMFQKWGGTAGATGNNMQFSDIYIYRNYFCDLGSTAKHYCVYIGESRVYDGLNGVRQDYDEPRFHPFIIEENFAPSTNKRPRLTYLKNGITGVYRNHCANSMSDPCAQRHGYGTQYWGNRTAGSGSWEMGGAGRSTLRTEMKCNIAGAYDMLWGSTDVVVGGVPQETNSMQSSDWYLLYKNAGTVNIGSGRSVQYDPGGGKVDNVDIWEHVSGSINITSARVIASTIRDHGAATAPSSIERPPVINGVTDANGTVLSSWNGTKTGLETGNQDP